MLARGGGGGGCVPFCWVDLFMLDAGAGTREGETYGRGGETRDIVVNYGDYAWVDK